MRSLAVACALAVIVLPAACSSEPPATTPVADAGLPEASDAEPAPFPILPYPPGPYGGSVGDVLPNFTIQGYPLSRRQRDATRVPFRDISLAEVRSDPACTCLVIVRNGAGNSCPPCRTLERTLVALMDANPHVCAIEPFDFNFDARTMDQPEGLITRGDIEDLALTNRPSFPVGLLTQSGNVALSAEVTTSYPSIYFVRPSDMRLLAFDVGLSGDLKQRVAEYCAGELMNPPVTVASGLSPRKLIIDPPKAFIIDWVDGVISVPLAGGAPSTIAKPATTPDAFAIDTTHVYWASSSEIARAPKTGGSTQVLGSGATSIAVDSTNVYVASSDGVIGSIPKDGDAVTTLSSGESAPKAIAIDDAFVFFIGRSGKAIYRVPKVGGAKTEIFDVAKFKTPGTAEVVYFTDLILRGAELFAPMADPRFPRGVIARMPKDGGADPVFDLDEAFVSALADAPDFGLMVAASSSKNIENLGAVGLVAPKLNGLVLAIGQRNVSGIGSNKPLLYWITNEDDVSAKQGALRSVVVPPLRPIGP